MDQASVGLDAVHIVIQFAILADNAVLHLGVRIRCRIGVRRWNRRVGYLAVCVKVIETGGQQIISLADPVPLICHDLARAVHVIVIAADLNEARVIPDALDVVIQFAVLIDNAFLARVIACDDHSAVFIEIIERLRKSRVIRIGDPVPRVLDRGIIPAAEIVVVSVFRQIQAVADSAFNGIIRIPVEVEQAGVLIDTAADTVFAEVIPINAIIVVVAFLHIAEARITVAQRIEVILFAVNRIPFFLYEGRPVIISGSQISRQPFTLQQLASVECVGHILKERPALAVQSFEGFLVKVVIAVLAVLIRQVPPTGLGHAVDGVIARAVQLDQPRDLTLARAGHLIEPIEILAALVVQAGDLVHALQRAVPDEVIGRAVDRSPARPGAVVQNEVVREVLIRFAVEMAAAGVRGIFRLLIGIDPILLLEGGLLGHAVKRVRAQIDVVADRTGVLDAQALRLVPLRAVLCGQLHAGEDADGVGRIGGDGLTLLDEIALHR